MMRSMFGIPCSFLVGLVMLVSSIIALACIKTVIWRVITAIS